MKAAAVAAAVVVAFLPSFAHARDLGLPPSPRVAIEGVEGPGPSEFDRVWVRKYGQSRSGCVMVMVPGSPAGQGGFGWVAQDIVDRVDGLAV